MEADESMNYKIQQEPREQMHFYGGIRVVYVIFGSVRLQMMDTCWELYKNDVAVINSGVMHQLSGSGGSGVCVASYGAELLVSLYGTEKNLFFICNSAADKSRPYGRIREIFREIIREYIRQNGRNVCRERSLLYKLLDCLWENYLGSEENLSGGIEGQNSERFQKILRYVHQNFGGNMSLSQLAEQLYTSPSTLSRFFKKNTGMYFADYVNQVRLRQVVQKLLYTQDSITRIAVDSGFSNMSVFNRVFKQAYAMSPSEYRKKNKVQIQAQDENEAAFVEKLKADFNKAKAPDQTIYAKADVSRGYPYSKIWNQMVNVGSASTLLMANTQYHVIYLAQNLGFKYARLWNLFSQQMMVTDGIHIGNYNYDQMDLVLDLLDQNGLIPFLDFGIRPKTAVKNPENHVYYGEECGEFQSRQAWEALIRDFIRHIVKRYGKEKVQRWIFEMSYDVRHKTRCYKEENYDFFNAYRFLYKTVKENLPNAFVGGPMGIPHFPKGFMENFLKQCKDWGCIPDFVSILLFPYITEEKNGDISYRRTWNPDFELEEIARVRKMIQKSGIKAKLYVSEWNNTLSSRNYLNDSCFRGAYFISKLARLGEMVDLTGVWMASDWVSSYYDVGGMANGGNGLLTKNTICKPVFYAFQFLNSLGEQVIAKGEHYWVTKNGWKDYYILCFNYKSLEEKADFADDYGEDPRELKQLYENNVPVNICMDLTGMKDGEYVVKRRIISPKDGSLLWEWQKFDFDDTLSGQEIKYIRQICFPRIHRKKQTVQQGVLHITETLGAYEMVLIHIYME